MFAVQTAHQVANAVMDITAQARQNDLDTKLESLNKEKEAELSNKSLTNSQRKAIDDKYKREEAKAKTEAWKADQKAKAETAVINGLLAFTMALAQNPITGYITGALALAAAAVEAGLILAKSPPKFAKGVVGLQGAGTATSDSIPAYLSRGESVITAAATERYAPILTAMNAGKWIEMPPMPNISSLDHLPRTDSETSSKAVVNEIQALRADLSTLKQVHVNVDGMGFTKYVATKTKRTQMVNDKYTF
jgi:hypothetical protein